MTREQLKDAARLQKNLDEIERAISYLTDIKRGTMLSHSPKMEISAETVTGAPITFSHELSKDIADFVMNIMNDQKRNIEAQIRAL